MCETELLSSWTLESLTKGIPRMKEGARVAGRTRTRVLTRLKSGK